MSRREPFCPRVWDAGIQYPGIRDRRKETQKPAVQGTQVSRACTQRTQVSSTHRQTDSGSPDVQCGQVTMQTSQMQDPYREPMFPGFPPPVD
ncbi:hypothetical protein Y1Q_0022914 [Alligator mississippiensis]|uniref:Uncharacterized protein n=1 Tax=Alligator mississippiensis TaxID=8496 RepID=A0A151MZH0_ALLMI|nr:hypothetical protein Y1Q_0022914 [Alligator mississippiensis]